MSSLPSFPTWWFRTPKSGLPPHFQMVGVAEANGGIGLVLTYQAELIEYLPETAESDPTLFNLLPARLTQVQVLELPSLAICRASGWAEEPLFQPDFTDLLAEAPELVGSDTLS